MAIDRLKILKMLEEGKLTAEEAAIILDASSPSQNDGGGLRFKPFKEFSDSNSSQGGGFISSSYSSSGAGQSQSSSSSASGSSGRKSQALGGGIGMSQTLGGGTGMSQRLGGGTGMSQALGGGTGMSQSLGANMSFSSFDDFSDSFNSSFSSFSGSIDSVSSSSCNVSGNGEKRFEISVSPGDNELALSGASGEIKAHGYNGDKLALKISYKVKDAAGNIDFLKTDNIYSLNFDREKFESLSIDASIPERSFRSISVSAEKSSVELASVYSALILVSSQEGSAKLKDVYADNIKVSCGKGTLALRDISSKILEADNLNGQIDAALVDCAMMKLTSANGSLKASAVEFSSFKEYLWELQSAGGKLEANLPSASDIGYHIKASASSGSVNIGMPKMVFASGTNALTEAISPDFEKKAKKVKLALKSSNGDIAVN
ncbi:MAG: DUF4097 domain-containing protein [Clostridiales bacterium]|jgi:hypothetical protein|nr:DUF4097 domain-containing protein [Clostridiales bacterium]